MANSLFPLPFKQLVRDLSLLRRYNTSKTPATTIPAPIRNRMMMTTAAATPPSVPPLPSSSDSLLLSFLVWSLVLPMLGP